MSEDPERVVLQLLEQAFKCGYGAGHRCGTDDALTLRTQAFSASTKEALVRAYNLDMEHAWQLLRRKMRDSARSKTPEVDHE